ncbi:MAG: ribonuclease J [Pseudomonadota bacterium]
MNPGREDFWFLPLGGCGEVGMNLNLYGHNGKWLMVDCGITFEANSNTNERARVVAADPQFITARQDSLAGIVATHAHEDHIGALPHLINQFRVPVYTTPFTANILRQKFRRADISATVIEVLSRETLTIGPFRVKWLPVTHSTLETHALLISTPVATVLHTADWKIDLDPVAGETFDAAMLQNLARLPLDAVVCDSTNATLPGHSLSESALAAGLKELVCATEGRVVVACFASNIARLQTLGRIAAETGRHLGVLGQSLQTMIDSAKSCGYLSAAFEPVDETCLGYLPPDELLVVTTGSQGEPGAALHQLAMDSHPHLNLAAGDTVLFSARAIPGNEANIKRLADRLIQADVRVIMASDANMPIHASGHPCADELDQLYRWTAPRLAIPVHGESTHLAANAEIARQAGVPAQLVGKNGDLFDIRADRLVHSAASSGRIPVNR